MGQELESLSQLVVQELESLPNWCFRSSRACLSGLKLVDDVDTRRSMSSHSSLSVVRAVSSIYPGGCGETNGNRRQK